MQLQPTDRSHRGRSRDRTDNARRRAQSKSPARAKLMQEQIENTNPHNSSSSSAGISRKFREFGEALRFKVGSKKPQQQPTNFVASPSNGVLKSNLKKQTSNNAMNGSGNDDGSVTALNNSAEDSNNDNRKVHFNKFATVQMME